MSQEEKLLKESFVMDMHLDLCYDLAISHERGEKNVLVSKYLDDMRAGNVNAVSAAVFIDTEYIEKGLALQKAVEQITALYQELDSCGGAFVLAKNVEDAIKAKENGQIAVFLAMEGVEPLLEKPELLRVFYELGVRILGICWSRSNWAGDGSRFFDFSYEGYGLTEKGKELIRYAQELHMIIDLTHTNEKTFYDVLACTEGPVLLTHSNTRALSDTPRNLSEEQIKAAAERGAVIGVNGSNLIVRFSDTEKASMADMAAHLWHIKEMGYPNALGVGLDQCDRIVDSSSTMQDTVGEINVFDMIPCYAKLHDFVHELLKVGFSEEEIKGILGNNALQVLKEVLG